MMERERERDSSQSALKFRQKLSEKTKKAWLKIEPSSRGRSPSASSLTGNLAEDTHSVIAQSTTESYGQDQLQSPSEDEDPKSKDMWELAEEELRRDETKRKEMDDFDSLMQKELGPSLGPEKVERQDQITRFIGSRVEKLRDKRDRAQPGVFSAKAQKSFERALVAVMKTKDVVSAAAAPCLPASIACAAVMLFLSVSVQAVEERDHFYESINTVSWSINHLVQYGALLWPSDGQPPEEEVRRLLVSACSAIMCFQVKAAAALEHSGITRKIRFAFKVDGWEEAISDIRQNEARVKDCAERKDLRLTLETHHMVTKMEQSRTLKHETQKADVLRGRAASFLQALYRHAYPYVEAKDRNRTPVEGTCKWFVEHAQFKAWDVPQTDVLPDASPFLYVTADPGCGKSVLSRHLVDTVLPRPERTVCYSFFKDDFEDQKGSFRAVCTLLHQLFLSNLHLLTDQHTILDEYEARGDKYFDSFTDVWKTFARAAGLQQTVCVLDALDECRDADRRQLFKAINEARIPTLLVLLTSRPYEHIYQDVSQQLARRAVTPIHLQGDRGAEAEEIVSEIQLVITDRIDEAERVFKLSSSERDLLELRVNAVPNRTYLWATLLFDGLIGQGTNITSKDVMSWTDNLPQGVDEAYEKILARSSEIQKTEKLLHIILAAQRPLTLPEITLALAIDERKTWAEVQAAVVPDHRMRDSIRNLCGLFVTVVDEKVYFLHQTAREFLVRNVHEEDEPSVRLRDVDRGIVAVLFHGSTLLYMLLLSVFRAIVRYSVPTQPRSWQHSMCLDESNAVLAAVCISGLLEASAVEAPHQMCKYSATSWDYHYRQSTDVFQMNAVRKARDLCLPPHRPRWVEGRVDRYQAVDRYLVKGSTLQVASALGLAEVVELLIAGDAHVELLDPDLQHTPLYLAAERGYVEVVEVLLAHDADCDPFDYTRSTPLAQAVKRGHEAVVRLLLSKGAQANVLDSDGRSPLSWAAETGSEAVVQLLLENNADINLLGPRGQSALSSAVARGHEAVVRQLLAGGATSNLPDSNGRPPLFWAALKGHESAALLLLRHGAKVDPVDSNGRSPLFWAAREGHRAVARLLVTHGAEVDLQDCEGQSPLFCAAAKGHEQVVELLLETGAKVDLLDSDHQSPLFHAAAAGHGGAVRRLLAKDANVNREDSRGSTPLHFAALYGSVDVIRQLAAAGAEISRFNNAGETPLWWACTRRRARASLFLESVGANAKRPLRFGEKHGDLELPPSEFDDDKEPIMLDEHDDPPRLIPPRMRDSSPHEWERIMQQEPKNL